MLLNAAAAPSAWVRRFAHLIVPGGTVLDLACGSGRHARWLAERGFSVLGVDRDAAALAGLVARNGSATLADPWGRPTPPGSVSTLQADLEGGPWPFEGRVFDGIVITNYLWRPLTPHILSALAPGGVLIHETFAHGQQTIGKPTRPDFLLQPGELLRLCAGLRVVAFEDGFEEDPARYVQRIAAVAGSASRRPDTASTADLADARAATSPSHGDTDTPRHVLRAGAGPDR